MSGLVCDAEAARQNLCSKSIAYGSIKERRAITPVQNLRGEKIAAGGVLADYVPFYFCNRSPMLGAVHKKLVPGCTVGQREIVYLVGSVDAVVETDLMWCFTDGHGIEGLTDFYDHLGDLSKIDWNAVKTWRWGGKWLLRNPDVKRKKQAEFLVHAQFPWELVERIGVMDKGMAAAVKEIITKTSHQPHVAIERDWYYN